MEAWLKKSGAVGLEDLEVRDFPITGRGVGARRPFKEGEKILTIPAKCLWTVKHAYEDPALGPVLRSAEPSLSDEDILALYILLARSRPHDPAYKSKQSHIATLPRSYPSSIFFTDEELEVCAGSSLYTLTAQLRGRVEADYQQLLTSVLIHHRHVFPLDKFGKHDYEWALSTIWSRGMDFALSDGNSVRLLAPFADMLNHSPDARQCHAYDPTTGDLFVLASADYEVGDQVFIYYGPVPNNRLLRLYGFVLPENPDDSYDLVLQTSHLAPLYEKKERLWRMAGLDPTCTVPLTARDPLPGSVLRYLRIQRLEKSELSAMTMQMTAGVNEKVSDENETQILQFLTKSIGTILDNFGNSMEDLTTQFAEVYPPGNNAWAAAQVSAGEQRVLRLAREKAESLLAAVVSELDDLAPLDRCANCAKDAAAARLMTCGKCKAIKYCSGDCQVAHFKEHKELCRSPAGKK